MATTADDEHVDFTSAQLATLKTNILANTAEVTYTDEITQQPVTLQIKNTAADSGQQANAVAAWYNLPCAVDFFANYKDVPLSVVKGAVSWKKLTPSDAIPVSPQLAVNLWTARSTACQGLVLNLQTILGMEQGGFVDATQAKVVTGLKDALEVVPSGVDGANQDAGWAAVQKKLCRKAKNIGKLLADTSGGNGADDTHAATFTFEGTIDGTDVTLARAS